MENKHPIRIIVEKQKKGNPSGIYSVCSANEYVIEAAMEEAMDYNTHVLIESTSNQVNQFGGYTGMKPVDFREFVFSIADKTGFERENIILGGDHLGPTPWKSENSDICMPKAAQLIRDCVSAGYTKIHIDTSMRLGDDNPDILLSSEIIAQRGAFLCHAAEEAFSEYKLHNPLAQRPVYIIGSEVPVPGGSQEEEDTLKVTGVKDFNNTIKVFKKAFMEQGLSEAWNNVTGVVVQPGVEFGDETIHQYDRNNAKALCSELKKYDNLVFEGHSTDYQRPELLRQMVEDGIAILKVGPALTFAAREALFMLSIIEGEIIEVTSCIKRSDFINILETAMLDNPKDWIRYYHGTEYEKKLSRKYSYSDRCRYYFNVSSVRESIFTLLKNLDKYGIPMTLLSQYMPSQYLKVRAGKLENKPEKLLKDKIKEVIRDYYYAVRPGIERL